MSRYITIAAAQYPLDELRSIAEYRAKITRWVEEAVGKGGVISTICVAVSLHTLSVTTSVMVNWPQVP